jgi:hypothetical protein
MHDKGENTVQMMRKALDGRRRGLSLQKVPRAHQRAEPISLLLRLVDCRCS